MIIGFKLLRDNARLPSYGGDDSGNAGIDLYACLNHPVMVNPGEHCVISAGVSWQPLAVQAGYRGEFIIKSRSSLGVKQSIECSNAGVVDGGYRGEIFIKLYNLSNTPFYIYPGDRIAQGVAFETPRYEIVELSEHIEEGVAIRGERGFGSTGK